MGFIIQEAGPSSSVPPSGSATSIETTPVWSSYLDLKTEVLPWLQLTNTKGNTTQLGLIHEMASTWVQNYLSRPVAPTQFTEMRDGYSGWDGAHMMLNYYPVLSVESVIETWGTSGQHTLSEQTAQYQGGQDAYQIDPRRGMIIRVFQGLIARPFFPGIRNIEVTYTAGYNPVPPDIKVATLELCKYWYVNSQEASRDTRIGGSTDYDDAGPNSLWPAIPNRITSLLEPYKAPTLA